MADTTTLVTGAAGFAGGYLLDLLGGSGEIVAWHRPGGSPPQAVAGVRWQGVDLLDAGDVREAIAEIRPGFVYHCGGAAHVGEAWNTTTVTLATNVRGTHNLIAALRDYVPDARVLITSSGLVYAPSDRALHEDDPLKPTTPYGLSKLAQEIVGTSQVPNVCIARPFNHIGPRQAASYAASGFAKRIAEIEAGRAAPEILVGNLEPLRDLTDVRDTVRAYRLILEHAPPLRPFNVCSGHTIAIRTVLDAMLERARVPIDVVPDPQRYRPVDLPVLQGDPTRIRTELGWAPVIPLERTIDDILDYWRTRPRST
jgi:GDP-4-dehydro-6-deoxy-D-mannose reductase